MLDKIFGILRNRRFCVLCTCRQDEPHCSLMSYAVSGNCREMYLLTSAGTRKFSNLSRNPRVSLLVDTRETACGDDPAQISALTISGEYQPFAAASETDAALQTLLARHPHLRELSTQPETRAIRIILKSFLFLQGISESYYMEID